MAWRSIRRILCGIGAGGGLAARAGAEAAARKMIARRVFFIVLESCSSREVKDLRPVVTGFHDGHSQIDLKRSERRFPAETEAGRSPEGKIVLDARYLAAGADDIV